MIKSNPCFQEFLRKKNTEAYIDGPCESLKSICIGSPVKNTSVKCRLSDILSEEIQTSDEEPPVQQRRLSDTEDKDVQSTSQLNYGEVERTSTSLIKENKKKEEIKTALVSTASNAYTLSYVLLVICIAFYCH